MGILSNTCCLHAIKHSNKGKYRTGNTRTHNGTQASLWVRRNSDFHAPRTYRNGCDAQCMRLVMTLITRWANEGHLTRFNLYDLKFNGTLAWQANSLKPKASFNVRNAESGVYHEHCLWNLGANYSAHTCAIHHICGTFQFNEIALTARVWCRQMVFRGWRVVGLSLSSMTLIDIYWHHASLCQNYSVSKFGEVKFESNCITLSRNRCCALFAVAHLCFTRCSLSKCT